MATNPIQLWRSQAERFRFLGKSGKIVRVAKVSTVPKELSPFAPYWVGVVELKGGQHLTAPIISLKRSPQPGDRVLGVMRRLRPPDERGVIEYGVKFKVQT